MNFSELRRLSGTLYKEISFQSIFALRSGGILRQRNTETVRTLINNARINTLISKILMTTFIGAFAIAVLFPLLLSDQANPVLQTSRIVGGVSAYLAAVLAIIALMGLQVTTSFVSTRVIELLNSLPISRKDSSTIVFLCFIRIFDMPLIMALFGFPILYSVISGSILGGLASFLSIGLTEIFALALTVGLGRFFYTRVATTGGGSRWRILLRIVFTLIWILPTFGVYLVVNFSLQIVEFFASISQTMGSSIQLLTLVYPFSFGFLVSLVSSLGDFNIRSFALSLAASLAYLALAIFLLKKIINTIRGIGVGSIGGAVRVSVKNTSIHVSAPWIGLIRKDLAVSSRLPSYASLFILPAVQAVIIAVSLFGAKDIGINETLGTLSGMSFLSLLIPTALFSIEGLASTYLRSLPITKGIVIFPKAALSTLTYIISLVALVVVALYLRKDFALMLTMGVIHIMAIMSANLLELVLLVRKYWKESFALGSLYSRLTTYIFILIPGLFIAVLPIVAAIFSTVSAPETTLLVFTVIELTEIACTTAFALYMSNH